MMLEGCVHLLFGSCAGVCARCRRLCDVGLWQYSMGSGVASMAMSVGAFASVVDFNLGGCCSPVSGGA